MTKRLKLFNEDENKEQRSSNSVGKGLKVAGATGLGMYGVHKLDKQLNAAEYINAALGIKRKNESVSQKIGRKVANVVGGPKAEEEIGKFNIPGKIKNKIKKHFEKEDVSTFRGSDKFIEPHRKVVDEAEELISKLEGHAKEIANKGGNTSAINQLIEETKNSERYLNAKNKVSKLEALKKKGEIAGKYAKGMNWVRDNWADGAKGKAKVAAIPLGIGATVGGVNHLINKYRESDKSSSERTYSAEDTNSETKKKHSNAALAGIGAATPVLLGTAATLGGSAYSSTATEEGRKAIVDRLVKKEGLKKRAAEKLSEE